eukprot:4863468-Prorocentrum_lima.AAC.1
MPLAVPTGQVVSERVKPDCRHPATDDLHTGEKSSAWRSRLPTTPCRPLLPSHKLPGARTPPR